MQSNNNKLSKIPQVSLEVYHRTESIPNRVLNGKALYSLDNNRFSFVENPPRAARSKLILASGHASLRRRHNGKFSINIVFERQEKYLKETILNEIRGLVQAANDYHDDEEENTHE